MTSTAQVTYPYYNSGVLSVPRARCDQLLESWTKRVFDVLDLYERRPDIVPGQGAPLDEPARRWPSPWSATTSRWPRLPVAANLSTTVTVHPLFAHEVTPPFVLHYHNEMDADGFVYRSRNRPAEPAHRRLQPRSAAELAGLRLLRPARPAAGPPRAAVGSRAAAGTSAGRSPTCAATGCSRRCAGGPSASPRARPGDDRRATPPFPFFVGCGRSGTTLLRAMFDAHPDVAVPDEVAFIIRYAPPALRRAVRLAAPLRRRPLHRPDRRRLVVPPVADHRGRGPRRARRCRRRRRSPTRSAGCTPSSPPAGASRATPTRPRCTCSTCAASAGCSPRPGSSTSSATAATSPLSYRSVGWGPTTVEDAAIRWRRSVRRGRRDGERLGPDRYREVRYEELVADPERGPARAVRVPRPRLGRRRAALPRAGRRRDRGDPVPRRPPAGCCSRRRPACATGAGR